MTMKTQFEGFGRSAVPEPRAPARKPRAKKSAPDKDEDVQLPKLKKGQHMALIESIMAEARGSSSGQNRNNPHSKPEEELPKQKKGVSPSMAGIIGAIGGQPGKNLVGRDLPKGSNKPGVIPHTESIEGYVGFLAEMAVGAAYNSKPRPPTPTGG